ncbi:M20 family metallopeptidase [Paenisporosarcina cavernae]|uniref:Peptidase M20 domain-containing protein 2 n=1 Tax=Paenisporosarcina cavernae TaxID=2320858 RepID=A0A385YSU3_9BACL|nr:M20 family metallopeptidase [Paenisporosarcina cavernae]AYC28513.1 M20 family peptidase [Paenisporosarcina cavernae]
MLEKLNEYLKELEKELWGMSDYLYHHPELGDQEVESMKLLSSYLEKHQFMVEKGIVGRKTAFKATFDSALPGPTIAFLAEYDALPDIGHGCGHNMIGTMSVGAGVLLSKVAMELGGKVVVLGTPAEETNGAKVDMASNGIFDDIDVAMMVHPADQSYQSGDSLAMDAIQFNFTGKSSHAAASPEEGINALDAVIHLFNGIATLRQHVPSDVRMHGIIKEGGIAANIIPEKASAQFYLRAKDRSTLNGIRKKVELIASGAAAMTGANIETHPYELSYDNMKTNKTLSALFTKNLLTSGVKKVHPAKSSTGSIDMGNVSHVIPAIHPYIGLDAPGLIAHTREFADRTITPVGHAVLSQGVFTLAKTAADILGNEILLQEIKEEFIQSNV